MAFDQLPPERKAELLRILKEHPRFAEDFKIPANVKNAEHWLIGRAGYWPDVVAKWQWQSIQPADMALSTQMFLPFEYTIVRELVRKLFGV